MLSISVAFIWFENLFPYKISTPSGRGSTLDVKRRQILMSQVGLSTEKGNVNLAGKL